MYTLSTSRMCDVCITLVKCINIKQMKVHIAWYTVLYSLHLISININYSQKCIYRFYTKYELAGLVLGCKTFTVCPTSKLCILIPLFLCLVAAIWRYPEILSTINDHAVCGHSDIKTITGSQQQKLKFRFCLNTTTNVPNKATY